MIYETKIINKFGADLFYPSPVLDFKFAIPQDGFIVYRSADPYGALSRYSEVIFEKGREEFKQTEDSNVLTKKLSPGKIRCVTRKDWTEPVHKFPSVWFLNLTDCPIVSLAIDIFNTGKRLQLFMQIPILTTVPLHSQFAKFQKYTIYPPVKHQSQMVGGIAGANIHEIADNRLEGKRSKQELERLDRMIREWKEAEKDRIKLM